MTWKRALALLLAIIGSCAAFAGYSLYHLISVVIPHSYAAWTTGDLLVEYMETHEGSWPREWKDLESARDSLIQKGRNIYWDFNKLPPVVKVDWTADPAVLAKAALAGGESELKVVTQLDGSRLEAKWGLDTEPNRKVGRYLIQKYATPLSIPSATNSVPDKAGTAK